MKIMTLTLLDIPELFGLSIEVYIICLLIAVTIFFFCRWVLKKFIKIEKTKQVVTWTVTLVATPIIYLGLIQLLMFAFTYTPSRDFDKSEWLTDKEGRFQMAGDIIKSDMLIGKDTSQVKQLLGDPTWGMNNSSFVYDMGFGSGGLGFMFHHLIIKFDSNKVISVEHGKIHD